jgi:hypothetical protein
MMLVLLMVKEITFKNVWGTHFKTTNKLVCLSLKDIFMQIKPLWATLRVNIKVVLLIFKEVTFLGCLGHTLQE